MYKLGLLLLVSGALCQHQVTQEITQPAPERQIRLDDIERDGLKSAPAAYQQPSQTYQQQAQAYQQQQPAAFQQAPQAYQQVALPTQQQAVHHIYHPQYQLAPSGTAYQTQQYAVPQQLFQPATYHQQLLQPLYLQPQAHHSYNVPLMLIPYPSGGLQQELIYPGITKLRAPLQGAVPQVQAPQIGVSQQAKFRPSPQVQYPSPYSSQIYQQKFAAGVKSTPAPAVKDNYVQQQPGFNYKLQ